MVRSGWAEHVPVGPFDAWLGDQPGANSAAPRLPPPDDESVSAALAELAALFARRGKRLTLELTEPLFPRLPRLIEAAGLSLVSREPILVCPVADLRPRHAAGVTVRFLQPGGPDADLRAFLGLADEAFGRRSSRDVLRAELARVGGRAAALAHLDGRPAGTGFLARYGDGVVEITRVATASWARRRGVAATLTTALVEDAVETGHDLAWLTASGPPAQALYQKLGFRILGDRLSYEAPRV
jgi:ribosomal protein S18 acetylase RimI-like enzyme